MDKNEVYSADIKTDPTAPVAATPAALTEDVASRAADRSADLYAETEHEGRASRYDRAISKARKR